MPNSEDAKEKIMQATIELLGKTDNPNSVTVRKIAERAGTGLGLINYYFTSRENLLYLAASKQMSSAADEFVKLTDSSDEPVESLRAMLKTLTDFALKNQMNNKIYAEYELLKGDFAACHYVLPLLKKIFGNTRTDTQLRLVALQIIAVAQVFSLRQDILFQFAGYNISNKSERDNLIDEIINSYVKGE